MSRKKSILFVLLLSVVCLGYLRYTTEPTEGFKIKEEKHKGVCWVGGRRVVTEEQVKALADKHVEWISQTPFGWQSGHDSPEIRVSRRSSSTNAQTYWGERDQGLITTTRLAKQYGIKTILKPHIWLRNSGDKWRADIAMNSEEEWQQWFKAYEDFILHYAQLAEEENIEILCIGTELHKTCQDRGEDWVPLIERIREVYKGKLTYAANFNQEYQDVAFWDKLDYIGVQAYFPLAESESPTLEELQKGWEKPIQDLERFSAQVGKPVLFTEVGYKSTKNAAIEPWTWPQSINREQRELLYSEETQALCYEALFKSVWDEPWLAGVYIWKWYPFYKEAVARRNNDQDRRNYFNIDFTPQEKKAEQVMIDWYGRK
ncbi:MAG: hypothetical protein AAFX87_24370 [Bacteroidota bacterium]